MPVRCDVLRLEPGHHAAAVLLQAARLVELGPVAVAHEAAVAAQVRGIVDERCLERVAEIAADGPQLAGDAPELLGQPHAFALRGEQLRRSGRRRPSRRARLRDRAASRARTRGARPRGQCRAPI